MYFSQHSNFAARLCWTRCNKSSMRNVGRCHNCSYSPFVIPGRAHGKFFQSLLFFSFFLLDSSFFSILQILGNFLRSFLDEDGSSSSVRYTNVFFSRWTWSVQWISANNCSLWDSSSRCDPNNANWEFVRSNFWISMSYSVEYNFLWTEFSPRIACWALHSRCPRRSRSSEEDYLWLFRITLIPFRWPFFDIDSATLIAQPSLSSLSLSCNGFPIACLLRFHSEEHNHLWEACNIEDSNTVWTPIWPVFMFVVFEKFEILWSRSLMSVVSSSTEVILSNSLGSYPVVRTGLARWPNCSCSCRLRLTCAFRSGSSAGSRGQRCQWGRSREWSRSDRQRSGWSKDGWNTRREKVS